jgi:hypothetical protein
MFIYLSIYIDIFIYKHPGAKEGDEKHVEEEDGRGTCRTGTL